LDAPCKQQSQSFWQAAKPLWLRRLNHPSRSYPTFARQRLNGSACGDGMDEPENSEDVPALQLLDSTRHFKGDRQSTCCQRLLHHPTTFSRTPTPTRARLIPPLRSTSTPSKHHHHSRPLVTPGKNRTLINPLRQTLWLPSRGAGLRCPAIPLSACESHFGPQVQG
jgi:hypothetical protein